jgi:hypothetical protein
VHDVRVHEGEVQVALRKDRSLLAG